MIGSGPPTTDEFSSRNRSLAGQSSLHKEGEPDVNDELEAVLIYSMSVSVDGFIADREGGFEWGVPNEEQFRFHLAQTRELGGFLCGRRLYETMLVWETDPSLRETELDAALSLLLLQTLGRREPGDDLLALVPAQLDLPELVRREL